MKKFIAIFSIMFLSVSGFSQKLTRDTKNSHTNRLAAEIGFRVPQSQSFPTITHLLNLKAANASGELMYTPDVDSGIVYWNFNRFLRLLDERDMAGMGGGVTAVGAFSATGNAAGLSIVGSDIFLHPATSTQPGGISTGAQTWAGVKSFTSTVKLANAGPSLYLNDGGSGNRVGISNYGARQDFFTTNAGNFIFYGGGDFVPGFIAPWMTIASTAVTLGSGVSLNLGAGTTFKTSNSGTGALTPSITLVDGGAGAKTILGKYGNDMHFVGNSSSAFVWYNDGDVAWPPTNLTMYASYSAGLHINPANIYTIPSASAQFSVRSSTKGSLPIPTMTSAQRTAIASPAVGLHVYQTDGTEGVYVYKSSGWAFAY